MGGWGSHRPTSDPLRTAMLTGSQLQRLNEALLASFPDAARLRMIARFADIDPSEIPAGVSLKEMAFYLVESAQRHGRLEALLDSAQKENPNNQMLAAAIEELRPLLVEPPSAPKSTSSMGTVERDTSAASVTGASDAVPTHFDRPASADELGRQALAEVLADRLRRLRGEDTEVPRGEWATRHALLVHLHAPWGAGKTSLLNLLRQELEVPRDARLLSWIAVEFDAWEHQRLAPPWWWLLAAIRREGAVGLRRRGRRSAAWFLLRDFRWRAWNARPALIAGVLVACLAALLP